MYCLAQQKQGAGAGSSGDSDSDDSAASESVPAFFQDPGYATLGHSTLSTSNCGNPALRLFGFGSVVPDVRRAPRNRAGHVADVFHFTGFRNRIHHQGVSTNFAAETLFKSSGKLSRLALPRTTASRSAPRASTCRRSGTSTLSGHTSSKFSECSRSCTEKATGSRTS